MFSTQSVINITPLSKDGSIQDCKWPEDGLHYIPDWVYTNKEVYEREMSCIFRGKTWNYVALEAEIPNVGDYKRSYVGDTPCGRLSCRGRQHPRFSRIAVRIAAPNFAGIAAATTPSSFALTTNGRMT